VQQLLDEREPKLAHARWRSAFLRSGKVHEEDVEWWCVIDD
jgi:hypothetical protein